jgi:hypothetical protein
MSKLSIIAVALLASFGMSATEKDKASDIYSEIMDGLKSEKPTIDKSSIADSSNFQESDEKSRYRNLKKLSELKNDYFGEKISELKNEQEIRQLKFLLELPIEKTFKDFNPDWVEEDSIVVGDTIPRYPAIKDQSLNFGDFKPETYKIDQLVIKEKASAPIIPIVNNNNNNNNNSGSIMLQSGNVTVIEPQLQDISLNDVSTIEDIQALDDIQDIQDIQELTKIDDSIGNIESNSSSDRLTDEELAELNWPREEYDKWLEQHKSHDDKREQVKSEAEIANTTNVAPKVVVVQYAEIKNLSIKKVIIFDNKKQIDLELDVYVGDGINGDSQKKKLKSVSEGDIITYKGFKFKINAITSSEVEILDMTSKKIYLASTNLSNL